MVFLSKNRTAKKYGVSQPGEMPSPFEKVRKSARVEENKRRKKIKFLMRPTRKMRQFKDVYEEENFSFFSIFWANP